MIPDEQEHAPVAFIGLVPAAIGIAYIIFYATDPERE
jgi:hypothetical protein